VRENTRRLALVTCAATLALLAAGVRQASASPAAIETATNTCWKDVVNDWLDHNGQILGTYAIPCYTQAIQHLSAYPDIQQYSSAIEDIHRALLAAIHQDHGNGPGNGGPGNNNSSSGGPSGPSGNGPSNPQGSGPIQSVIHPSNAFSVPLPLIVLGALAGLLLLSAAATWFVRRVQTRRMTPAPAPARRP
jgi:hypothetical protein